MSITHLVAQCPLVYGVRLAGVQGAHSLARVSFILYSVVTLALLFVGVQILSAPIISCKIGYVYNRKLTRKTLFVL